MADTLQRYWIGTAWGWKGYAITGEGISPAYRRVWVFAVSKNVHSPKDSQLLAFLMSLSTLHPYMNCCRANKIQTIGPKAKYNLFRASQTDFNTFGRQPRVRQSSQDNVIINSNQNTIIHLALIIHCSYASRSTNADTRKTQQNVELSLAGYQSSSRVSLAPKLILLILDKSQHRNTKIVKIVNARTAAASKCCLRFVVANIYQNTISQINISGLPATWH